MDVIKPIVVWLSATLPVKEPLIGPADPSSSNQNSLPAADDSKDGPASEAKPDPNPDAWIQVEKRHRQTSGKSKAGDGGDEVRKIQL